MWKWSILVLCSGCFFSAMARDSVLVWSDEFEEEGLPDPTRWSFEEGYLRNNEAQYYTVKRPENAWVRDGVLRISALLEDDTITSASLITRDKASWKYGRVDVRAKFDVANGTWPAIWMLSESQPYGTWPKSGEIDIMEQVGFQPNLVHGTIHTEWYNHTINTQKGETISLDPLHDTWHLYSVIWDQDSILIQADGQTYMRFGNEGAVGYWPFDHPFYLILNMAIGGSWGGTQGIDSTAFPIHMDIDYVRVYKMDVDKGPYSFYAQVEGSGSIEAYPHQSVFNALDTLVLTAHPQTGWEFLRWEDGSRRNPDTLIVDHSIRRTAVFVPAGERVFPSSFAQGFGTWAFWNDATTPASVALSNGFACMDVQTAGQSWQVQMHYPGLILANNEAYDLRFLAYSTTNQRPISVNLVMNHAPHGPLSSAYSTPLSTQTTAYQHRFTVQTTDAQARLEFDVGQATGMVCLDSISLRKVQSSTSTQGVLKASPSVPSWQILRGQGQWLWGYQDGDGRWHYRNGLGRRSWPKTATFEP